MNSRERLRKRILLPTITLLLIGASLLAGRTQGRPAAAQQDMTGRCLINAPQDWGKYLDSGSYGVVFEDTNGTLRFVNRFPCGLEGAPTVALEIRRK